MKKFIFILVALISVTTASAQSIISTISKHKNFARITELCTSYNNMEVKHEYEPEDNVKAIYSKYMVETLQLIGAVYTGTEVSPENQMKLFNIGYDIMELNKIIHKISACGKIDQGDYVLIKALEKDISDNMRR